MSWPQALVAFAVLLALNALIVIFDPDAECRVAQSDNYDPPAYCYPQ